jgi:beta-glucosidase
LPITFPQSIEQLPPFEDYSMQGRTYKYMTAAPLYPFGFGLGYAKLEWVAPTITSATLKKDQNLDFSINIKNSGAVDAEEVVQVYLSIENPDEALPIASLVNFKRVAIAKGASSTVSFSIPHGDFSYINRKGEKVSHQGKATVTVANAAPGERSRQLGAQAFKINVNVN